MFYKPSFGFKQIFLLSMHRPLQIQRKTLNNKLGFNEHLVIKVKIVNHNFICKYFFLIVPLQLGFDTVLSKFMHLLMLLLTKTALEWAAIF